MEYENSLYLRNLKYPNMLPSYLENSVLKPRAFYHTDFKDSLENIVLKDEPESKKETEKGLLEKIFSDKTKTLKATIKALFNEITLRERLDFHLLYRINGDMSKQNTHLLNLNNLKAHYYSFNAFMDLQNKKKQLEDNILELEKEKRKEYLECWRDLMFLKKYLLTALKDYWELSKRRNALALSYDFNVHAENENSEGH